MIYSPLLNQIQGLQHGFGTIDRAQQAAPLPNVFLPKQTHSDIICDLDALDAVPENLTYEADAVVTSKQGQAIGIRTADCTPILIVIVGAPLAAPLCVAAIHAGRVGTEKQITRKVIEYLMSERGKGVQPVAPTDIYVAIGPCIQECCHAIDNGRSTINMPAINKAQLIEQGVPAEQIEVSDLCTHCRKDLFYSYRRDGEKAGRQISWLRIYQ